MIKKDFSYYLHKYFDYSYSQFAGLMIAYTRQPKSFNISQKKAINILYSQLTHYDKMIGEIKNRKKIEYKNEY
jgi:hypothetical protein